MKRGVSMFGKKGLLLILLVTLLTAFTACAAEFSFNGTVFYPNGTACPFANVSLNVPSFLTQGNAIWNGSWSNLTNASGYFSVNVTGYASSLPNLKLNIKYNVTTGTGVANLVNGTTFIGPNLPPFPTQMYNVNQGGELASQTFYMVRAGSITLTVLNSSSSGFSNFSYIIRDTTLGTEVDSYMTFPPNIFNVTIALPLARNYSINIMLGDGPPLKWTNLTYANFSSYNMSQFGDQATNDTVVYYAPLQLNATTSTQFIDGYLVYANGSRLTNNTSPSASPTPNITKFEVWMTTIEGSNYVCMNDNCLMNMTKLQGPFAALTGANATSGYYNYTFAGTNGGLDTLLVVIVNVSNTWFIGLQNVTTTYGDAAQYRQNITMLPIAGSNYVSGTNLKKCPQTFIRLINATGSPLDNIGNGMMEVQLNYNISNGDFIPKLSLQTNNTGIATFPLSSSYGVKGVKSFVSRYPPRDVKFAASAMDGDISMTLYSLETKSFDGSSSLGATMQMLVSNTTCDVMTPPASCIISSSADNAFNPMSAILRGAVSMRMLVTGGMILHYINVDLLSSGPPDFIADANATSYTSVRGGLNDARRLGSRGPKIYSGVLVGFNYSASPPDLAVNVSMKFSTLYDSENTLIWNTTANGSGYSGYSSLIANYSDYNDYNYTWFVGQNCSKSLTGTLALNKCLYNRSTAYLWMYLPHFSNVGSQITGITAGGITLNVSNSVSCNTNCYVYFNVTNLNFTISPQNENANITWIINVTSDSAGHRNQSINISYMNATQSWVYNGSNLSQYVNYSFTYYNSTNDERIWNTTHKYRLDILRNSNVSEQLFINYTVIASDKTNFNLTINLTLACIETWSTTDWSTCSGGMQTRTATDSAKCGTTATKPSESQACTSGASSGGGGGGASSSVTWTKMIAGQTYTYDVPDHSIAFERLTVVPNTDLTNVKVVVRQLPEKPTDVVKEPVGNLYKYMSIAKDGITNTQIQRAAVKFGVDKAWVDGKGKKENIVLLRYVGDKWEKLTPKYIGEENGKYKYESDTPGFSYFAIAFQTPEQQTAQEQQNKETTPAETAAETTGPENLFEQKEAKKSSWGTVAIALIVLLAIIIAFYFVYEHKKHSGSLEGYRYKPRH